MVRRDLAKLDLKPGDQIAVLLKDMVFRCRFQSVLDEPDSDLLHVTSQDPGQPKINWAFDLYQAIAIGKLVEESPIIEATEADCL